MMVAEIVPLPLPEHYRTCRKRQWEVLRHYVVLSNPFVRSAPSFRSLIAATNASAFFPLFFLPCFAAFFCSTAPQAFFRPDRRFRTPTRAEAVKVGRRSAIEAYSHLSRPRLLARLLPTTGSRAALPT